MQCYRSTQCPESIEASSFLVDLVVWAVLAAHIHRTRYVTGTHEERSLVTRFNHQTTGRALDR